MTNVDTEQDRARGAIVGLTVGDALGAPVEFESRAAIAARFPDGVRGFTSGGWMNVTPGELTDDSRMMIDLAETLLLGDPPDLAELGRRFVAWADEGPKDIGNTTRLAIDHLRDGVAPEEAGRLALQTRGVGGASSNGSVMRCAPVAVRYRHHPDDLRRHSITTSLVTHAEDRCLWSCVAVNQGIAHLLNGGSLSNLIPAATADVENAEVVEAVETSVGLGNDDLRGTGFVLNAVRIAFWATLTQPSFEEAIVAAVAIGDDTDTNAAVAGSLAGAHWGYGAIPERWRTGVQQREYVLDLADRLFVAGQR